MVHTPLQLVAFCLLAIVVAGCTGTQQQRRAVERPPVITEEDLKSNSSAPSEAERPLAETPPAPTTTQPQLPPAVSGSGEPLPPPPAIGGSREPRPLTEPSQPSRARFEKGPTGWERVTPKR